jgi:hypothetical protein
MLSESLHPTTPYPGCAAIRFPNSSKLPLRLCAGLRKSAGLPETNARINVASSVSWTSHVLSSYPVALRASNPALVSLQSGQLLRGPCNLSALHADGIPVFSPERAPSQRRVSQSHTLAPYTGPKFSKEQKSNQSRPGVFHTTTGNGSLPSASTCARPFSVIR